MSHSSSDPVRDQQLAKIIENELSMILSGAGDSRLHEVEIVRVEPKPGGRHFLIIYGPPLDAADIGGPGDAHNLLTKAHKYIRAELAQCLNLKFAPELSFAPDPVRWAEWGR